MCTGGHHEAGIPGTNPIMLEYLVDCGVVWDNTSGPKEQSALPPHIQTLSGQETINLSAAECAKRKSALPQLANDPRLCTLIHGWTETITTPATVAKSAHMAATTCPSTIQSFHDWITDHVTYQMTLNTTFEWMQDCWAPVLAHQSCLVDWTYGGTTVTSQRCYSYNYYTANWESTVAVYTGWVNSQFAGQTWAGWESQRRECYSDYPGHACDWTGWAGQ